VKNPNEVLVKNAFIGVNFIDTYHRTGLYKVQLPFVLGRDGAGIVEEIGNDVKNVKVGDRVCYPYSVNGSYAEYALVSSNFAYKIPDNVSFEVATCSMISGLTAQTFTRTTFPIKKGDYVLVHAAAGGLGQFLAQIAKHLGAIVIGTTSTPEKAEVAKACGCDHVILYTTQDFVEETLKLTNRKGVNVIYDSVGLTTFEKGFSCLAKHGMMVLCGNSSGKVSTMDMGLINQGAKFVVRPSMSFYIETLEEFNERCKEVFQWIQDGVLKPPQITTFPLKDAAKAHELLEGRSTIGKLLLFP